MRERINEAAEKSLSMLPLLSDVLSADLFRAVRSAAWSMTGNFLVFVADRPAVLVLAGLVARPRHRNGISPMAATLSQQSLLLVARCRARASRGCKAEWSGLGRCLELTLRICTDCRHFAFSTLRPRTARRRAEST